MVHFCRDAKIANEKCGILIGVIMTWEHRLYYIVVT